MDSVVSWFILIMIVVIAVYAISKRAKGVNRKDYYTSSVKTSTDWTYKK